MKPAVTKALKSRWLAGCVHAGFWLLLYLGILGLRGRFPDFHEGDSSLPPQTTVPVTRLGPLLTKEIWPGVLTNSDLLNPFLTRHFIPPPQPPPPAPTTRKIEVTYQGFYETEGSSTQTVVKLGDVFLITPIGAKVTANLYAAEACMDFLMLTNTAAVTNILPLNAKQQIEVPIE